MDLKAVRLCFYIIFKYNFSYQQGHTCPPTIKHNVEETLVEYKLYNCFEINTEIQNCKDMKRLYEGNCPKYD